MSSYNKGKARFASLAAVMALACLAGACLAPAGAQGGPIALAAEGDLKPRLERIVERNPLPEGWTVAKAGETPSWTLRLEASPQGASPSESSASCGSYYRATAVDLADERYSVSEDEAERLGLEDLETIVPPRRALSVDSLWPGQVGYPFTYDLTLSASSSAIGGAIPSALEAWIKASAAKEKDSSSSPLLLAAAGDIQVRQERASAIAGGKESLGRLIAPALLERIRRADFAVANLETPISGRGEPNPKKHYQFRMPRGSSSLLREAGFELVLFANNHGFDYGPEAFLDTMDELEKEGLSFIGAGRNSSEAAAAKSVVTASGEKLAFVGFAFYPTENYGFSLADAAAGPDKPGISTDETAALESVREAAAKGETVIVLAHGGIEYQLNPSQAAMKLYDRFAKAGAALVLGSHPHILQGCAARNGSLIAYSLGNFVFTREGEPETAWKSGLLELLVYRGKVRALRLFPTVVSYGGTVADPDRAAADSHFSRLCAELE
jgi:poly-gamma-glutamate capsule biosynthesis protein CapA/YwtB (metallophosphatase superfamily)